MAVPRARMLDLVKLQSQVYNHSFNPTCVRTGNKVLRQRLRGPALAAYYPPKVGNYSTLEKMLPEWEGWDEKWSSREDHLTKLRSKGKSPPKKKRTAEESKKFNKGKKK